MAKLINKNLRVFFWLKKKKTSDLKSQHILAENVRKNETNNMTIASFWQTQLMNIAEESNIKK